MPSLLPKAALGAAFAVFLAASPAAAREPADMEELRQHSLERVNASRKEAGLEALELQEALVEAAQNHADDMLERGYYSHTSPEGETVKDRYLEAGGEKGKLLAENIARCEGCPVPSGEDAVESLHQGWMNSPEHRRNILMEGLSHYGFGIAEDEGGTRYAVETFSGPGTPRGTVSGEPEPLAPEAQTAFFVERLNEIRGQTDVAALEPSQKLATASRQALPDDPGTQNPLDEMASLREVLPPDQRWRRFRLLAGRCGGCGSQPTDADIAFFVEQWKDDPRYSKIILSPDMQAAGLAIRADGEGGKLVAAILAGN